MPDINEEAQAFLGTWMQLKSKADGFIEGRVLSYDKRPATYEGQPRISRKTGALRYEWVFTVLPDGDDEPVKFSLMESGQRAVSAAIKESGQPAKMGDRLEIWVKADKVKETDQPEYAARWTPGVELLDAPTPDTTTLEDEEPF